MKCGVILIAFLTLQASVLSAEFAGGTGEPNDPYRIATAEQLISIGTVEGVQYKHFVLIEDIDLDPNLPGGRVFTDTLIAQDSSWLFRGVFDGQDHTISNLHIEGKEGYSTGLFGMLDGMVKDLHLTDVVVSSSGSPCGAIAGQNQGMILRCSVTGKISGAKKVGGLTGSNMSSGSLMECEAQVQVTGDEDVGGLVGFNSHGSLLECIAEVQVAGSDNVGGMVGGGHGGILMHCEVQAEVSGQQIIGGLAGEYHHGHIIESRTTGIVTGSNYVGGLVGDPMGTLIMRSSVNCEVSAEQIAGGLVGYSILPDIMFVNCYAQGSVAGSIVGGLAGESSHNKLTINCYSACELTGLEFNGKEPVVGGLIGKTLFPVFAPMKIPCFWDAEFSGIAVSTGSDGRGSEPPELGIGLTTNQMLDEEVFLNAGWDFSHVWMICEGEYPKLQWEVEDCNDL